MDFNFRKLTKPLLGPAKPAKPPSVLSQIRAAKDLATLDRIMDLVPGCRAKPKTIRIWESAAKVRRAELEPAPTE